MNINDVIALARAGYTKDEISALAQQAQPAPVQQAQPAPAPLQQEQPAPAPLQQEQPATAPVQQDQPAPVQQERLPYDMLAQLSEKIEGLTNAYRAGNILNSQMPEVKRETAQDALASIIIPTYNKKEA